jgi:hypothetical protein
MHRLPVNRHLSPPTVMARTAATSRFLADDE